MRDEHPARDPESGPSWLGRLTRAEAEVAWYHVLFALCTVATVLPIWAGPVLPFQDFAGNMTYAVILADSAVDGSLYQRVYETGGPLLPNGLAFFTWAWLGPLLGFVTAGKLILTAYAVALPLSVDRLLVAAGRERRFALLAFPAVYNLSAVMGFVSYVTALPLALFAVGQAMRFHARPTWPRGALVAVLSMLTFLGHAQGYLVLGVMALALVLTLPRTWRQFLLLCAPFAASLLLFVPWAFEQFVAPPDPSALGGADLRPYYHRPVELFALLAKYTFVLWGGVVDDWVFLGCVAVALVGFACRRVERLPALGRSRFAIEAVTLALVLTYLVVPEHTYVQAVIGSRLVVLAFLVGLGWLALPRAPAARLGLMTAMAALSLTYGLSAASGVARYNRTESGPEVLSLVDSVPEGARLAVFLPYRSSEVTDVNAHEHVYGYHFAFNRGLAYTGFHSYYGRHARWRDDRRVPGHGHDPLGFLGSPTACWYEFALLRSATLPRWHKYDDAVTYMGSTLNYSLWKLDHAQLPACRPPSTDEPIEDAPDVDATARHVTGT